MARTFSKMVQLGKSVPKFSLPDTTGKIVSSEEFAGGGLLVAFLCNHCPFVKHIADGFSEATTRWISAGLKVVGINSNDAENYPEDDLDGMKTEVIKRGYKFPYLVDETQRVAKDFDASCTPDFFLYDSKGKLFYRGQFDGSRPGNNISVTGKDLSLAVVALLNGEKGPIDQKPSLGCNIKWKV